MMAHCQMILRFIVTPSLGAVPRILNMSNCISLNYRKSLYENEKSSIFVYRLVKYERRRLHILNDYVICDVNRMNGEHCRLTERPLLTFQRALSSRSGGLILCWQVPLFWDLHREGSVHIFSLCLYSIISRSSHYQALGCLDTIDSPISIFSHYSPRHLCILPQRRTWHLQRDGKCLQCRDEQWT